MSARVLFHVQHLLGIGHLRRATLVARALVARGFAVDLVSGGLPLPGFDLGGARLVQLPAMQAGPGGFGDLRDGAGRPVDEAWRAARRDRLLALLHEGRPDIVIVESFPFGRRALLFELQPLLDAVAAMRPRPLRVCSVRDIVQRRAPARDAETLACLRRYFDMVLVHGDPALVPFAESFPPAGEIAEILHYTGIVTAPQTVCGTRRGIVVSAGGGAVGQALLRTAAQASRLAAGPWQLLCGPNLPLSDLDGLRALADPNAIVERFRPDFPALLAGAAVSVSQAGYNTVADLLATRTPAVLVPYAAGGESEQPLRTARLQALGLAVALPEATLTPDVLLAAADRAMALDPPGALDRALALEGGEVTGQILSHAIGLDGCNPEGL